MGYSYGGWMFGWVWVMWIGFTFLIMSSFGSWGYAYRTHRKVDELPGKAAQAILNERYARGEITREQFLQLKADIAKP
jgi:putative membrane protein